MITPDQHVEIRRLYYGEHWKVGTIAAALGVHHETVRAAIVNDTQGMRRGTCRAMQLDPYLPFIRDMNRTGFIGGPIPREDGPDAPTQQVLPGAA